MKEKLGHKIKALRKTKNLSQEKLANKAELSQQHISRIEKGLTFPCVATLTKIANVLNISINDLVDNDIFQMEDKYTVDILRKVELLSIEDKIKVLGYVDRMLDENGLLFVSTK